MAAYNIEEHRHRFAVWAAARAVQTARVGGSTEEICEAIEESGVRKEIARGDQLPRNHREFEQWHGELCYTIWKKLWRNEPNRYGCAAKILAVYLKTVIVIPHKANSDFIACIHPPIDSKLLENVPRPENLPDEARELFKKPWSKLTKEEYVAIIKALQEHVLKEDAFWKLEKDWCPCKEC